jgi:hypothetical protein
MTEQVIITFEFRVYDEILNGKDLFFGVGDASVMPSYDDNKFGFAQMIDTMGSCQD